jgi:hypothetical protein
MATVVEAHPRLEAMIVEHGVDAPGMLVFPQRIL